MRVLIWGTGRLAGKVAGKHIAADQIVAYIDTHKKTEEYMGRKW